MFVSTNVHHEYNPKHLYCFHNFQIIPMLLTVMRMQMLNLKGIKMPMVMQTQNQKHLLNPKAKLMHFLMHWRILIHWQMPILTHSLKDLTMPKHWHYPKLMQKPMLTHWLTLMHLLKQIYFLMPMRIVTHCLKRMRICFHLHLQI
jgi:hypothetical protein